MKKTLCPIHKSGFPTPFVHYNDDVINEWPISVSPDDKWHGHFAHDDISTKGSIGTERSAINREWRTGKENKSSHPLGSATSKSRKGRGDEKSLILNVSLTICHFRGQFHINILQAAFSQVDSLLTNWHTVQNIQCKSWAHYLVLCSGKVGHNFVGETEWAKRIITRAFVP